MVVTLERHAAHLSAGHMAGVGGVGRSGAASSIVEFRHDTLFRGRSVTILHTCTLHTQNEGGLDEPFKAGCSKSVLRLNDKFEPQILGQSDVARFANPKAGDAGRQVAGKAFQSVSRPPKLSHTSWKDRK